VPRSLPSRLALFAAAHVAGIALADAAWLALDASVTGACLALALAALARAAWTRAAATAFAFLAAGGLALGARLDAAARARPHAPSEQTVDAIVARSARAGGALRLDLVQVADAEGDGGRAVPERIRLVVDAEDLSAAPVLVEAGRGDRLRLRVRLRPPLGLANPGATDADRALARAGIGALARPAHPRLAVRVASPGARGPYARLESLRRGLAARLEAAGPGGTLLAALALGERGAFPAPLREAFARLGISHLLSVSGLHLVIVAGASYTLARRGLARAGALAARTDTRLLALVPALAAAALYTLVSGADVPVRRSLVFLAAAALSPLLRRPAERSAGVASAVLVVLAAEPDALFAPGAQMSFAASVALVAARPLVARAAEGRLLRGLGAVRALVATSAVASAATAPLVALHLGVVQPAGLVANLVAVPWTGFVLMPAAFVAAAAAALPAGRASQLVVEGAERVASLSCDAVLRAAAHTPALTASPAPAAPWLLLAALCAGPALRARRLAPRVAAALASAALLAFAPSSSVVPSPPRVVFLDVGQGDATIVQGRGAALLVDGGTALPGGLDLGARAVVPALLALGVTRLDLVAATHGDLDHRGGLPAVLRALPVARVWLPHGGVADPAFAEIVAAAAAAGALVEEQGAGGAPLQVGDLRVEPLWPPRAEREASRNDRSLTLRVELAGHRVLLPGDLEAEAERALRASGRPLRADVLKLGHHGSRTSSTAAWLAAVDGAVAVASAPRSGRFGMPHPEVIARAGAAGYALWWTGRDGAVLVGFAPRLHVRGWRR
jgi:competence protein ComEC